MPSSSSSSTTTTTPRKGASPHHNHHHHHRNKRHSHSPSANHPSMCIILSRVDMYDMPQLSGVPDQHQQQQQQQGSHNGPPPPSSVDYFSFDPPLPQAPAKLSKGRVSFTKVPHSIISPASQQSNSLVVMDNSVPNPYGPNIDKYWKQRRRLFSKFDDGIQLDEEGWFSVTPEIIADHVAQRLADMADQAGIVADQPLVVLDAFCGCGGNAIAFAKHPNVTVVASDVDRTKLRKAAHNAAIYRIPPHKIIFVECNVLFLLEFCFRDGEYILDRPIATPEQIDALLAAMPPPVPMESVAGYSIGGIDLLPRHIDAVFMDPPWGGVDYEVFGKHGYCLEKNMRIKRPVPPAAQAASVGASGDDFFDSFQPRTKQERKSQFNVGLDDTNCVNGVGLLRLAATATARRWVVYDIPRNTNRTSLAGAALTAGYRGNIKLEEHYLNGRLKTVTAYMGTDWTHLLKNQEATSIDTPPPHSR